MAGPFNDRGILMFAAIALCALFLTWGCVPPEYPPTENTDLNVCVRDPECTDKLASGHRGMGGQGRWAPENTFAAFETAWKMGTDSIEIDVRDTLDGVPVIMHDSTVDRTTNGSGRVDEMTLEEIQALQITYSSPLVPPQTVPTFREALAFLRGKTLVDVDFKSADIPQLVQIIEEEGMLDAAYLRIDEMAQGVEARTADPAVALMPKVHDLTEVQDYLDNLGSIDLFDIEFEDATVEVVEAIQEEGIKILMDAMGDPDAAGSSGYQLLIDQGADMILTDLLENLVPFLNTLPPA